MQALGQELSGERKGEIAVAESAAPGDAKMTGGPRKLTVTLLPMTATDLGEVDAIERDLFPSPWPRKAFLRALKSRDTRFFTAFESGTVVGYAGMRFGDSAHILNIAVHRDYRRKKIGSQMLALLLDLAVRHSARCVTLEVRSSNTTAQSIYRKFGFAPVAVRKGYYAREKESAIVMAKEIGEVAASERPRATEQRALDPGV